MTVSEICRQRLVSGVALKGAIEETLVILQAVSRTIPGRLPRCEEKGEYRPIQFEHVPISCMATDTHSNTATAKHGPRTRSVDIVGCTLSYNRYNRIGQLRRELRSTQSQPCWTVKRNPYNRNQTGTALSASQSRASRGI